MSFQVEVEFVALAEQLKGQLGQINDSLQQMVGASGQAGEAAGSMGQSVFEGVVTAELAVKALTAAFEGVKEAIGSVIERGITFNASMAQSALGVGTLIATMSDLRDANGNLLKGQQALTAGLELGERQIQALRIGSFQTVATVRELTDAYQQGLGPMLAAGVGLDDTTRLTVKFAQAAGALGLDIHTLGHELRATFSGTISPRITKIASALQISSEDIQKWKQAGTLVEEMNKRLEFFGLAGEKVEASWKGVTSNLEHAFEAGAGQMTKPLFDSLLEGLHNALNGAFDTSTGEFSKLFDGLLDAGKTTFEALGDLSKGALSWAVQAAEDLSAWFKENRADVIEMVGAMKALAMQIGGILKDVVSVGAAANQAQGQFSILRTVVEGIGLVIAVIRDVVSAVAYALQTVGVFLLQGVLGPIQLVLIGIGEAMNYVKKGSGDMVVKVAEDMQKFLDAGHAGADAFLKPILEGKGAVAQFGDALLDAKIKAQSLEEATKKAGDSAVTASAKAAKEKQQDKSEALRAMEQEVFLQGEALKMMPKATLAEQEALAIAKAKLEAARALAKIQADNEKRDDGTGKIVKGISDKDAAERRLAVQKAELAEEEKAHKEFSDKREAMMGDLQSRLTAQEDGGLAKRLEAVRKTFAALRKENEQLAKDGQKPMSEAEIQAAEDAAKAQARRDQVKADLAQLKQQMTELAQINGGPLTSGQMDEALDRFARKSPEAAAAASKLRQELHLGEGALAGFKDGLQMWVATATNTFQTFKAAATQVLGGVTNAFASGIQGILSGQMSLSQGIKSIWAGIVSSIAGAVAQMIAQWLVLAAVKKALGLEENATDGGRTAAAMTTATAETWAAYAGIPFAGPVLAEAQIVAMYASMAASSGMASAMGAKVATGMRVGGLVTEPQFTYLAEDRVPEVVAPQRDFMDWARTMVAMGANLQANVQRNDRVTMGYSSQAASYASATSGQQSGLSNPQGNGGTVLNLAIHNPTILDSSRRGLRTFGGMVIDGARAAARERSVVLVPGQVFGGL
ncbi:MAG: phage tail tape measure C-terminal domain-containing protein [Geothrix sp.]|nr:phage tail tape measure C-terminal domain-containing protein [Geothrix sp.]